MVLGFNFTVKESIQFDNIQSKFHILIIMVIVVTCYPSFHSGQEFNLQSILPCNITVPLAATKGILESQSQSAKATC